MSKKERLVFSKIIREKVGYSQKNNTVVIVRIFKNTLEEIDLLKMLSEL